MTFRLLENNGFEEFQCTKCTLTASNLTIKIEAVITKLIFQVVISFRNAWCYWACLTSRTVAYGLQATAPCWVQMGRCWRLSSTRSLVWSRGGPMHEKFFFRGCCCFSPWKIMSSTAAIFNAILYSLGIDNASILPVLPRTFLMVWLEKTDFFGELVLSCPRFDRRSKASLRFQGRGNI